MSLQDIVVGKGAMESDCVGLEEGLVESVEVLGKYSGVGCCCCCFEEANMGMNSPNSSSCVLLLGSALFSGVDSCDIRGSGRVSGGFGVVVVDLELHSQPIAMDVQLNRIVRL